MYICYVKVTADSIIFRQWWWNCLMNSCQHCQYFFCVKHIWMSTMCVRLPQQSTSLQYVTVTQWGRRLHWKLSRHWLKGLWWRRDALIMMQGPRIHAHLLIYMYYHASLDRRYTDLYHHFPVEICFYNLLTILSHIFFPVLFLKQCIFTKDLLSMSW